MKPVQSDETEMLRVARERYPSAASLKYVGYDSKQGHVWIVQDETNTWLARGWFGADGDPHFVDMR